MSERGRAVALKLPKGTIDYIKANPQIAQLVGQAVSTGLELQVPPEAICKVLEKPHVLADLEASIESGTKEDLENFLACVKQAVSHPLDMGMRTTEEIQQIQDSMKESFVYTQVDSVGDKTESKEAEV